MTTADQRCEDCVAYKFGLCLLLKSGWFDEAGLHPKEEDCRRPASKKEKRE